MNNANTPFIFFGTPDFSTIVLGELEKNGFLPRLVVTSPDKPQGRKMIITPSPVKKWAVERGIPVFQPEKLNESSFAKLKESGADLFVVAAYGKMIPKEILQIPKFGTLCWHPSLLPKLRGASPMISSILTENKTGVSVILLDKEMDHGPIVAQKEILSWEDDLNNLPKASDLEILLAKAGGQMLAEILPKHIRGETTPKPQEHEKATFVKKITKEDGLLDLKEDDEKNFRKIRAFNTWPRAHFFQGPDEKKRRVIVTDAEMKDGKLVIKKVLPESGKEMPYEEFLRRNADGVL
jgi:methionyl-tRNA formyltransferase